MVFHPVVLHFPIAFYFLEFLLIVFWLAKTDPEYLRFSRFAFRLGYLTMLVTVITGWIDAGGFVTRVRLHASFAASVLILYTLRLVYWQIAKPDQKNYRNWQFIGSLLGIILVTVTGFAGGALVYGE